jgi:hypothetical protein
VSTVVHYTLLRQDVDSKSTLHAEARATGYLSAVFASRSAAGDTDAGSPQPRMAIIT